MKAILFPTLSRNGYLCPRKQCRQFFLSPRLVFCDPIVQIFVLYSLRFKTSTELLQTLNKISHVRFRISQIWRYAESATPNSKYHSLLCCESLRNLDHFFWGFLVWNETNQMIRSRRGRDGIPIPDSPIQKRLHQLLQIQLGLGCVDWGDLFQCLSQHREEQGVCLSPAVEFSCIAVIGFGVAPRSHFVAGDVPRRWAGLEITTSPMEIQGDPRVLNLDFKNGMKQRRQMCKMRKNTQSGKTREEPPPNLSWAFLVPRGKYMPDSIPTAPLATCECYKPALSDGSSARCTA